MLRLLPLATSAPAELLALAPSALTGCDGFLVMPGGMFWSNRATILGIASIARLPAIYLERECADDGGLIAYGPNVPAISAWLLATSIVFFAEPTPAIFPSTPHHNSISSSISAPPTRLSFRFRPILSLQPTR
jgi:hypothetical protein